jgi:hypothetical protein
MFMTRDQGAIFEIDASQYLLAVGEAPTAVRLKEHDRLLIIIVRRAATNVAAVEIIVMELG